MSSKARESMKMKGWKRKRCSESEIRLLSSGGIRGYVFRRSIGVSGLVSDVAR